MPHVKRSSPSEDIMPNVVRVLDLILMGINSKKRNGKKLHDIYSQIANETCLPQIGRTTGKQCVRLANSALSSHRYTEAAKLLWILCQDRSVFDMFIYRASMIVLENLQLDNQDEIIYTLIKELQNLELINKKEVQLEYMIHGLTNGSAKLKENLEALINMKRTKYLRKNPLLDPIFEGYIMYLQWFEFHDNLSKYETNEETYKKELETIQSLADDAVLKLKTLLNNPGNWDIFVLKLVELLERCGKGEEVKSLLLKYVESHPDHLNAHIYLSLHLCEIDEDSKLLMYHLEKISEMSPSDERVLILLEKLKFLDRKLEKCFMFLDYPSNGKNQRAWSMLLEFISKAKLRKNQSALKTLETCWSSRQKSWFWLYFNPSQVPQLEQTELVVVKVKVLSYLDKDHEFIKEVLEKFPTLLSEKESW